MGITYPMALIFGAGLIALPTLIHFLARSKPVRLRYPTVRFLREALKQRKALFRFRDIAVLVLRALAVVLLAAAFARLFTRASSAIALEGDAPTVRIVVLDTSESMEARKSVVQVFDRALAAARKYVHYRPNLKANVVVAAARAIPLFERTSENLTELEGALARIQPRPETIDVQAALACAARLFQDSRGESAQSRELIIISDFQLTNWQRAPFDLIPSDVTVRFEQVGLTGDVGNISVTDVRSAGWLRAGEVSSLAVEIGNFSSVAQTVEAVVEIGDNVYRGEVECAAWSLGQAMVPLPADIVADGGDGQVEWIHGKARIVDVKDALPADDERSFVIPVAHPPEFVFISRENDSTVATSRYYLERALAGDEMVRIVNPAHLDADTLARADLVVVAGAGSLPAESVRLLSALAARGMAILFAVEDSRDAENVLALEAASNGEFKLPVTFSAEVRSSGQMRRLADFRATQRPFKILAANTALVGAIEFAGGMTSIQRQGGTPEEVLATYDDQSAALIATSFGRGRVAIINAEISQSTLRASPLFVPLVCELAEFLTADDAARQTSVAVGAPLQVFLPASVAGAADTEIVGPPAAPVPCGTVEDTLAGVFWYWQAVECPGIYSVMQNARLTYVVAAACPAVEADLRLLDPEILKNSFASGSTVEVNRISTDAPEKDQRREWWPYLMLSAIMCMLAELGLLKAFRS